MAFVNTYRPPVARTVTEPAPDPFDVYYNGPVPEKLETDRVRLELFIPSIHAKVFFTQYTQAPELEKYLPLAWPDYTSFLSGLHHFIFSDPKSLLFAIIDRTKENDGADYDESLAGVIGFIDHNPSNLSVEIGPVIILPRAQRTFVSSNAIGRILKYALDLPEDGGMGYRRVAWMANPNNSASIRAAERMGFKIEGVARWKWVLPADKDGGYPPVDGKRGEGQGRASTVLSLCWDDWEAGVKQQVEKMIERV